MELDRPQLIAFNSYILMLQNLVLANIKEGDNDVVADGA